MRQTHLPADIYSTRLALATGETSLVDVLEQANAVATSRVCRHVYVPGAPTQITPHAADYSQALAGLPVSVKDLFDVEGQITAAGSTVLANAPTA